MILTPMLHKQPFMLPSRCSKTLPLHNRPRASPTLECTIKGLARALQGRRTTTALKSLMPTLQALRSQTHTISTLTIWVSMSLLLTSKSPPPNIPPPNLRTHGQIVSIVSFTTNTATILMISRLHRCPGLTSSLRSCTVRLLASRISMRSFRRLSGTRPSSPLFIGTATQGHTSTPLSSPPLLAGLRVGPHFLLRCCNND
jgi:hypothetical protein